MIPPPPDNGAPPVAMSYSCSNDDCDVLLTLRVWRPHDHTCHRNVFSFPCLSSYSVELSVKTYGGVEV
jgi:hypothetical protein